MTNKKGKAVIAIDLDRTLLPNGKQEYDKTIPVFNEVLKEKELPLVYVTGRNIKLVKKAINRFNIPSSDYVISSVGTRIYYIKNSKRFERKKVKFRCDKNWFKIIKKRTPDWNVRKMHNSLKKINGLRIQEKENQDKFKLSYYVDLNKKEKILKQAKEKLKEFKNIKIIYSKDYPQKRGLVDIIPSCTTKKGALDYVVDRMNRNKKEIIFCGDSGNDLSLLISEYKSILVKNSSQEVKKKAKEQKKHQKNLYIASSGKYRKELNGNYVSGVLQGMIYFNIVDKDELDI